ncbi:MAG: hypothetical protein GX833_07560 [Clostridium sp.]|jgi:hypothetical protein|nr:hypothetical protein [Clostridium sp.]
MFKKKIDRAFDAVRDQDEPFDEEQYRNNIQMEMEQGDLLALILGAYRFFLPLFIGIILIIVLLITVGS